MTLLLGAGRWCGPDAAMLRVAVTGGK
jgi:hypothetical protein